LDQTNTRYQAYISYSHADARFARWLQRALENWRMPAQLSSQFGFNRIRPVFLDRADLRAATDLGDSLNQVLANSSALIVVCTHNSAKSEWVEKEILRFREVHGDDRIFPIIAGDTPPDCFPPALLHDAQGVEHTPVAADARRGHDGRGNALLKIIASLLDVGFDDLKRRELRQKYQRMAFVAAGSLAIAVMTIVLAIAAYDARNDANRRREQAEDLISFMLGDLRSRLEPIGRLAVLNAVGDKALQYFGSLEDDELTPETLLERARALRQIGEVRMSQGDLTEALEAFELSNEQARRLLPLHEPVEPVEFEMSQSHFWVGYVHYERLEIDRARYHFEQYLRLAETLFARHPDNVAYQTEVAYALSNLGTLELKQRRFSEADEHYQKTAAINRAMVAAAPEDIGPKKDLAETLSWLGEIAAESGDLQAGTRWFTEEYLLRTAIVGQTDDMGQVEGLADAAMLLGESELMAGQLESSTKHLKEAHRLAQELVLRDEENAWWQRLYVYSNVLLSQVAAATGDIPLAMSHIDSAVADIYRLAENKAFFKEENRRVLMLEALAQRARVLKQAGDERSHEAVRKALDTVQNWELAGNVDAMLTVAGLQLLDGELYAKAGHVPQAEKAWSAAQSTLDALPSDLHTPLALMTRAAYLDRSNQAAEAAELRIQIAQLGFRDTEDRALTHALIGVL
jgi:tetratricopeptide (TPR) repeat protein